ncbi:MAG: helix-turn-helix transcriptional regulator [Pseudomonadota bacterium]
MDTFLTTKEVADLLRVKERKVYDLASAGEIPHRRITGKLLFPREKLTAWLGGAPAERPSVLAGSHDPLLEWAVLESGAPLALLFNGSGPGLDTYAKGEAALTGLHIQAERWNIDTVAARAPADSVLLAFAARTRGLILAPHLAGTVTDLRAASAHRFVLRQGGTGTAALLERLSAEAGVGALDGTRVRTESDAAAAIAAGEGDVTLGIEAMARRFRLPFVPLLTERFDLLIDRRAHFTPPVQALLAFARTPVFAQKAAALGGYDLCDHGTVRWLGA